MVAISPAGSEPTARSGLQPQPEPTARSGPQPEPTARSGRQSQPEPTAPTRTSTSPHTHRYAGPDRRKPLAPTRLRGAVLRAVATVAAVAATWGALAAVIAPRSPLAEHTLVVLSRSIAGALLLAAAALALAVWRITGTSRSACAVIGLALAGLATPTLGILGDTTVGLEPAAGATAAVGLIALLAGIVEVSLVACTAGAMLLPAVLSRLRPAVIAVPVALCYVALAAAVVVEWDHRGAHGSYARAAGPLEAACAVAWAALAIGFAIRWQRHRADRTRRGRLDLGLAAALILPTVGSALRATSGPANYQTGVGVAGFDLVVSAAILCTAMIALWRLHTASGTRLLQVASQLDETRTDLAEFTSQQAERLHDARNALFAIAGATQLLAHPDEISDSDATHLHELVVAELNRLGTMLDPSIDAAPQRFQAADLLVPILAAYRAQGMTITAEIDDCALYTRRDALANAVANLLTNARVHAAGARVWVSARRIAASTTPGTFVRITIADDGPGIPASERDAVLRPGVRGTGVTAPGSGLGLASAARMVGELGGVLQLAERAGGGTSVTLTVPAAHPARESHHGDKQRV